MIPRPSATCSILALFLAAPAWAASPEDSVLKIVATIRQPNPIRPWAKQAAVQVQGTGVVLPDKTILTNAHVVTYAAEVAIQPRDGGDSFDARVEALGPEIDLATLKLDDESLFDRCPPLPRADRRPTSNVPVAVYGFPVGGDGLAITRGVISRVDFTFYDDLLAGLRLQVDAAVNPGNSGGPALVEGKMVGLTYGQLGMAENVGYVIPNEEIDAYLEDVKDGRYDGKPRLFARYQSLENEALRARLGLSRSVRGIMVRGTARSPVPEPFRDYDVLTHLGDVALDNQGNVAFEEGLRLPFLALIPRLASDGSVPARVVREGKTIEVRLPLLTDDTRLIKPYRGQAPRYFVHGPLVFSPAMSDVTSIYARANPLALSGSPLLSRGSDRQAFPGEELVVVTSPFLPHRITKGYAEPFGLVVRDVDGVAVKNLRHLVELLRDGRDEFVTFRFFGDAAETLVFRRKALEASTEEVMGENGVPKRGSDDLMAVWATPGPVGS